MPPHKAEPVVRRPETGKVGVEGGRARWGRVRREGKGERSREGPSLGASLPE